MKIVIKGRKTVIFLLQFGLIFFIMSTRTTLKVIRLIHRHFHGFERSKAKKSLLKAQNSG